MTHAHDDITVGKTTLRYSEKHRGWLTPAKLIIRNPVAAQRVAEVLNEAQKGQGNKEVAERRLKANIERNNWPEFDPEREDS